MSHSTDTEVGNRERERGAEKLGAASGVGSGCSAAGVGGAVELTAGASWAVGSRAVGELGSGEQCCG